MDWQCIEAAYLAAYGCAVLKRVLSGETCARLRHLYSDDDAFRSRVVMARHGFGRGEDQYLCYSLPDVVAELRTSLYTPLASIANRWNQALDVELRYPLEHAEYL